LCGLNGGYFRISLAALLALSAPEPFLPFFFPLEDPLLFAA
jgi:hypothetical protein